MKRLLLLYVMLATVVTGCSQNHFNIPSENFADRVRVLGIAPILVDADSDIKHPQKEQLIQLVTETNRKYEQQLVRKRIVDRADRRSNLATMLGWWQELVDGRR